MKPTITREDFMNGVALAAGGALLRPLELLADSAGPDPTAREYLLAQGISQGDPRYYPPGLTGVRGTHPGSFEVAHALRDGKRWDTAAASDTVAAQMQLVVDQSTVQLVSDLVAYYGELHMKLITKVGPISVLRTNIETINVLYENSQAEVRKVGGLLGKWLGVAIGTIFAAPGVIIVAAVGIAIGCLVARLACATL